MGYHYFFSARVRVKVVDGSLLLSRDADAVGSDDSAASSVTLSLLSVLGRRGFAVVALVVCACAVLIVAFLLATLGLLRHRRRQRRYRKPADTPPSCNGDKTYNCRVETLKVNVTFSDQ